MQIKQIIEKQNKFNLVIHTYIFIEIINIFLIVFLTANQHSKLTFILDYLFSDWFYQIETNKKETNIPNNLHICSVLIERQ